MNREVHVRFWEGLRVRFPWATHLRTCYSWLRWVSVIHVELTVAYPTLGLVQALR